MTAFHPLSPAKAIEMVEVAGVADAARVIRDFAAAGLVKSYALVVETVAPGGEKACIRGGALAADLWKRIVAEGVDMDVWTSGTIRLAGSDLIGGAPAVSITGIGFKHADLQRLVDHHRGGASKRSSRVTAATALQPSIEVALVKMPGPARQRKAADLSALQSGALHLTVEQTKAALAIGHTTLYKLLNAGDLERAPSKAGTRITAESVRRYAGLSD